jgi:L-iditol 2-dehydrogenase
MYYANSDVRIQEMPVPEIARDEILVRVIASGICGSDVMEWYRKDRVPLVLGHEVAGIVEKAGAEAGNFKAGDRVAVSHHVPCGECRYCRRGHETVCETLRKTNFFPGGFSEFIRVPAVNIKRKGVYPIPDKVSFDEATFVEPLACVMRGQRLAGVRKGDNILVIGSGISGLLHIKYARASGAGFITATDISGYRLEAARRFGADRVFDGREYRPSGSGGLGIIGGRCHSLRRCEASRPAGLDSVERGGTVLFFAAAEKDLVMPGSINGIFWRNEVNLSHLMRRHPGNTSRHGAYRAGDVKVKDMVTPRFGLAKAQEGFGLSLRRGFDQSHHCAPGVNRVHLIARNNKEVMRWCCYTRPYRAGRGRTLAYRRVQRPCPV